MDFNANENMDKISEEYFRNLLKEIHHDVILLAVKELRDKEKVIKEVNENWPDGEQWLNNFNDLASQTASSLEEHYKQMEMDFNKLFDEWEKFKREHAING